MQIFDVRETASRMTEKGSKVALNSINPGFAKTERTRHTTGVQRISMIVPKALLPRVAKEASKTLVRAACVGRESHGLCFTNCVVRLCPRATPQRQHMDTTPPEILSRNL